MYNYLLLTAYFFNLFIYKSAGSFKYFRMLAYLKKKILSTLETAIKKNLQCKLQYFCSCVAHC